MNPYTEHRVLRPLFESIASLIVMPFVILTLAVAFFVILLTLLVMWPLAPFFVYAERKKELTEEEDDRKE